MKKKAAILFTCALMIFSSFALHAQSSGADLDQVELAKQLLGNWEIELGEDTILMVEASPFGKGIEVIWTWEANGIPFNKAKQIIGFTQKYRKVNMFTLYKNGMISRDLGGFVSESKLVMERFSANHSNLYYKYELNFSEPDKMIAKGISKGKSGTWDDAEEKEFIWIRVKD